MLRISREQVGVLRAVTISRFEAAMMERCAALAPGRCAELGEVGLRIAVRAAIARAASHGFTWTGPVRLFVELSVLLGSGFDGDVLHPFARECLTAGGTQMQRATSLCSRSVAALREVRGPGGRHDVAALWRLRELVASRAASPPSRDLAGALLGTMAYVHPEKYAQVGEPALRSLIEHAESEARWYGLPGPEDVLLIVGLMFALGQGCLEDPFHPWIAACIDRERHADRALVGEQLRRQALARLGQALRGTRPPA